MRVEAAPLRLSDADRSCLDGCARSQVAAARIVRRSRIVLGCSEGLPVALIAIRCACAPSQVRKWRRRFLESGVKGLEDAPRSGRPPQISPQERARVVSVACRDPMTLGQHRARWSCGSLARYVVDSGRVRAVSRASISRILRAADLQPHRVRMWCHSKDPLYDAKLADITALYVNAPACEPVLCIDEKSQIQALWRHHRRDPRPGRLARLQFDYVRRGTRCLFAAFNVRSGQVLGRMRPRRTSADFLGFLDEVALRYRQGVVHLVLDNLNTHYGPAVRAWNARHGRRFRFHYTPTHASWLNQVEIFFGILTRRVLRHARFASTRDLDRALLGFLGCWNRAEAHPFRWTYREPALVA